MSHEVENMAYVGQTPWHGLGNRLAQGQSIYVWAMQAGMDWTVKTSDVQFIDPVSDHHTQVFTYPEQKVLYRSDTHAPLSVVSSRYKVVQPREILEFYRDLTEIAGFELETAGVLRGGRKVWALARTGQSAVIQRRDETRGYVLLATACDGTLATTAQFTAIRVVCNNTLAVALEGGGAVVKVPHSTQFNPEAVKAQLGIAVSSWDSFMYQMKKLSECRVAHAEAERFIRRMFDVGHDDAVVSKGVAKSMDKVMTLYNGNGRGSEMGSARGTALGLLNAVTEYVDHEKRARSTDYRLDSAWFGQGAAFKQKALTQALVMAA